MTTLEDVKAWNTQFNAYHEKYSECCLFDNTLDKAFGYIRMNKIVDIADDAFVSCSFQDVSNTSIVEVLIPESLISNVSRLLSGDTCVIAVVPFNLKFLVDGGDNYVILGRFSLTNIKKEVGTENKNNWIAIRE